MEWQKRLSPKPNTKNVQIFRAVFDRAEFGAWNPEIKHGWRLDSRGRQNRQNCWKDLGNWGKSQESIENFIEI